MSALRGWVCTLFDALLVYAWLTTCLLLCYIVSILFVFFAYVVITLLCSGLLAVACCVVGFNGGALFTGWV